MVVPCGGRSGSRLAALKSIAPAHSSPLDLWHGRAREGGVSRDPGSLAEGRRRPRGDRRALVAMAVGERRIEVALERLVLTLAEAS
jgi:hypothetical protein